MPQKPDKINRKLFNDIDKETGNTDIYISGLRRTE
jgi:hypothetical protein